MPSKKWIFRVVDILQSIEKIENYLGNTPLADFQNNTLVQDAVIRNLEIIGEASNHVPEEIQIKFSEIPWQQMKGMRNMLIHEYFGIDNEIVWHTAKNHLPRLKQPIQELIKIHKKEGCEE